MKDKAIITARKRALNMPGKCILIWLFLVFISTIPAWAVDFDDSLTGSIESIFATSGDSPVVQYFTIVLKEYPEMYFRMDRPEAIKYGLYDESAQGGFNRAKLDELEGKVVELRVDETGEEGWYKVKSFRVTTLSPITPAAPTPATPPSPPAKVAPPTVSPQDIKPGEPATPLPQPPPLPPPPPMPE